MVPGPPIGAKPLARFVSFAAAGTLPEEMGVGPVYAIPKALKLAGLKLEDIAACEEIFTTLMGEDVESRRKFIEENALDVKNLDI